MTKPFPTLVPFGKYRNQPVEVMVADIQYVEWLMTQDWFTNGRYQSVYNTIVNFGAVDAKTPEHNKMQVRFLDDEVCKAFMKAIRCSCDDTISKRFEFHNWDVVILGENNGVCLELKPTLGDDYSSVLRQVEKRMQYEQAVVERAVAANGVFDWKEYSRLLYFKTLLPVVVYDEFNGTSATEKQVRQIFAASNIYSHSYSRMLELAEEAQNGAHSSSPCSVRGEP